MAARHSRAADHCCLDSVSPSKCSVLHTRSLFTLSSGVKSSCDARGAQDHWRSGRDRWHASEEWQGQTDIQAKSGRDRLAPVGCICRPIGLGGLLDDIMGMGFGECESFKGVLETVKNDSQVRDSSKLSDTSIVSCSFSRPSTR